MTSGGRGPGSGRIPPEVIERVLQATDLVELIGSYLPLRQAGRTHKALCPFHHEKTPSFIVNPDRQIFHCFGCGEGGNAIGFLMRREAFTFPEAVRALAERAGIALPSWRERGEDDGRLRLFEAQRVAAEQFQTHLRGPDGEAARRALAARGVDEATAERFGLGLALASWDALAKALARKEIPAAVAERGGLVVARKPGTGHYDRFRNRLMVPIQDVRGRVIGFSGRALDGAEAKYINSPETPIYRKGDHLFGLAQARPAIQRQRQAILVEGAFDCIQLHRAGFEHTVASLGTAVTPEQVALLRRHTERVVLAFDPDRAGLEAAFRGFEALLAADVGVEAVRLPEGLDPDLLVRREGPEAFRALLESPIDLVDLAGIRVRDDGEAATRGAANARPAGGAAVEGRVALSKRLVPILARMPEGTRRAAYVGKLAERLGVSEAAVLAELKRATEAGRASRPGEEQRPGPPAPAQRLPDRAELTLVQLLLLRPDLLERAGEALGTLGDPGLRRVSEMILVHRGAGEAELRAALCQDEDPEARRVASLLLVADREEFAEADRILADCLGAIRRAAERARRHDLTRRMREAEARGDREALEQLKAEHPAWSRPGA